MDSAAFSSVTESIYSLLSVLLGQFNFEQLRDYNEILGFALFATYVILLFFFILSSFVAIIEEAFGQAKEAAKSRYDMLANLLSARLRDRLTEIRRRGRKLQRYAQRTRSTNVSGARFTLRARHTTGLTHQPTRLAQMTDAVRNVLKRATVPNSYSRPEEERLRRAAWMELHNRHKSTHELMARLHKARKQQCALLEKVVQQKQQQMAQLEELSTQLWNCWQLVADAGATPTAEQPVSPHQMPH